VAVVVAFVPSPRGWKAETGLSGIGPDGMNEVVADSLHAIAESLREQLVKQEEDWRNRKAPS
jgi:hypothetical protein